VVARITTTMNQILDNKERRFVGLATANVPELVDSAVLERWHIIYVPIPDENGVRAILAHKLGLTLSAEPIDDVVEVVVAAMRGDFLKVTIAGQTRDYQRLDLLSGRKVTKAVEQAAETAAVRDADFGLRRPTGVCAEDIIASLTTQFENVGRSISPHNAASHLPLTIEEAQQVTHIHVVRRDTCRASATSFARVMN
jgi:SpoVK/Ycf46/Vps4 family AAA+-type ATPase